MSASPFVGEDLTKHIEENDRWQQKGKLYYSPAVIETEARVPRLVKIARRQAELRKAA